VAEAGERQVEFINFGDEAAVRAALSAGRLLWIETPSNPLLGITDIEKSQRWVELPEH